MPNICNAIEIDSPAVATILQTLVPELRDYSYDELHMNFIVLNVPTPNNWQLVAASDMRMFDHLEPGVRMKVVQAITK